MQKITLLALSLLLSLPLTTHATEHHSGHGGGPKGGGGGASGCVKAQLTKFAPAHLTEVVPGAEFSFFAFNIAKADQISITVKNIPVDFEAEFKDPYFLIKSKLPVELVKTFARINIKVKAKSPDCEAENGWLLNIAEK
ncbi:MAG: hypothetical protein NTY69_01800 [Methylococcales bacterium]|nr:hypothetical protein [Methylococcales bacterium]